MSRIANLPHPRNGSPSRYLVCPDTGIYEFTKVATPKTAPRSWLIEGNVSSQTISEPEMFVATAIDPLFLIIPALVPKASREDGEKKRLFLLSDDYFDKLPEDASHLSELLRCERTRKRFENRLAAVCDSVDAGDESMFRINEQKLAGVIWDKAKWLGQSGSLPASIEEKFVTKALEAPLLFQRREMTGVNGAASVAAADSTASTPKPENVDSQLSLATEDSNVSAMSQVSTAATSVVEDAPANTEVSSSTSASPQIVQLQRLRVAFDFICATYLSDHLAEMLKQTSLVKEATSVDFAPLDLFIQKLDKLRAEAMAARSVSDYSRKRAYDEEEDEARAEKKRKLEEEKKRKATQSRGVKQLEKVNTTGMKKLSAFFTKK
ncbi:hypothetical protein VHEMI07412 [[Torrubiella] hemipterigena]|uniref:Ribonuclease H2 subunit B n=1 Tax=[Torrubiella] hemipterigena TaxID=1531966 RepID=A0A0A1TAC9_9HYPO|nr:hypothetical protein VHEMI07412 [[Torrubiella] hemipterigena]